MVDILEDFLRDRNQRFAIKSQRSSWVYIYANVPQGCIIGPLLSLININDLSNRIISKSKLFSDPTSLLSVVHNTDTAANNLNHDLEKKGSRNNI